MLRLALAGLLAFTSPAETLEVDAGLCDLAVRTTELDYATFESAASLRLAGVRIRPVDGEADPKCVGRVHAYVELRSGEEGWGLNLILSDGRAWYRPIEAGEDQAERALASALANLVAAIEDTGLEPDAQDVEVPEAIAEPEPEPEPEPPEPEPEPPAPEESESEPEPEPEPPRTRVLELAPRLLGGIVVGLSPIAGIRSFGGGGGVDLRLPKGLAAGLELRVAGASDDGFSLTRVRVGLGAGWIPRVGAFEMTMMALAIVEPWSARRDGERLDFDASPLLGAALRLAPGGSFELGPIRLRVGLPIELAAAVQAGSGRAGSIPGAESDHANLRVGGIELSAGLAVAVWIPVFDRRGTPRRSRR